MIISKHNQVLVNQRAEGSSSLITPTRTNMLLALPDLTGSAPRAGNLPRKMSKKHARGLGVSHNQIM